MQRQRHPPHKRDRRINYETANDLFRKAHSSGELCAWCFGRKRRLHPEHDAAEAEALRWGATKGTLEAKGHRILEDGTLEVRTATSEPDPSTFQETVPETWIDGEFYPSRSYTICTCGVIDYSDRDHRTLTQLHDCVDNLADWYAGEDLEQFPSDFNAQQAHAIVSLLRRHDSLCGQDEIVLTEAMRRGICRR